MLENAGFEGLKAWAVAWGLSALGFLAPIQETLYAALFMICMDLATGYWRSYKSGNGRFTSHKFGKTITKALGYSQLIITAMVMEKYLIPNIPCISIAASAIAIREGLSIVENISVVTGTDFIALFIEKLTGGDGDKGLENLRPNVAREDASSEQPEPKRRPRQTKKASAKRPPRKRRP